VRTVAVCGGSGAEFIAAARLAGADAYLTADLKHHQVVEAVTERDSELALIDAAHWATEHPWLHDLAARLRARFGTTVDIDVSAQVTDPWSVHLPSRESRPNPT
jgi:putative NIF3 family GTP cyclohydrolase 1 type 2